MTIGKRIKAARERLGMTQDELGAHFDITGQAVSGWEQGPGGPDKHKYPKLRQILRITFVWLIQGTGDPPHPDDPQVRLEDAMAELYAVREIKDRG